METNQNHVVLYIILAIISKDSQIGPQVGKECPRDNYVQQGQSDTVMVVYTDITCKVKIQLHNDVYQLNMEICGIDCIGDLWQVGEKQQFSMLLGELKVDLMVCIYYLFKIVEGIFFIKKICTPLHSCRTVALCQGLERKNQPLPHPR